VTRDAAGGDQPREVGALQADEAVAVGARLLDVREPDEYDAGHAPLATSIPLGELARRVDELPRDALIVCVCRSGVRSAAAAQALSAADFEAVNLAGGMQAWAAAQAPAKSPRAMRAPISNSNSANVGVAIEAA